MPRISDKRERLISAADTLIHRQGFYRTTLAHIAEEAKVPLGNVYYYFQDQGRYLQGGYCGTQAGIVVHAEKLLQEKGTKGGLDESN